jgi:hypothetical protein
MLERGIEVDHSNIYKQFYRRVVGWKMATRTDGSARFGVQGFDGVGARYEEFGAVFPAGIWVDPAYGATIRDRGARSTMCGQAVLYDEPRVRVSSWAPLRLTRLRCERESVVVVSPHAPVLFVTRETDHEACDCDGPSPHFRGSGDSGGRTITRARPRRHDVTRARRVRQKPAPQPRSGPRSYRQYDGGRASSLGLCLRASSSPIPRR